MTPEFYVIYTGTDDWDAKELRLSDSFIGDVLENSLDLVVKIIDVRYNKEEAKEILARSEKLRGYSLLVNYIKQYWKEGCSLEDAIDLAVNRCIEEGVLRDFLKKHGQEAKGMIYEDITLEEFLQIRGEECREEGMEAGMKAGEERFAMLCDLLIGQNRLEDMKRAAKDKAYRAELYQEFAL